MDDIWRLLRVCGGKSSVPPGSVWSSHQPADTLSGSIAWSPELNRFVVVNTVNKMMTSSTGTSWSIHNLSQPLSTYGWHDVTWSSELGIFVAVGEVQTNLFPPETIMTSSNGINWTSHVGPRYGLWRGVEWSPELGMFVAVRAVTDGIPQPAFMTSTDGVTWTTRTYTGPTATLGFVAVCWSPDLGIFVASGRNKEYAISADGINWQTYVFPSNSSQKINWSSTYNLFYAFSGSNFWYSSDGLTWTPSTSATGPGSNSFPQMVAVDTGQNLVAAVGYGPIYTSTNGTTWTRSDPFSFSAQPYGMAYSPSLNIIAMSLSGAPFMVSSP